MKKQVINNDALTVRVNTEAVEDAIDAGLDAVENTAGEVVNVVGKSLDVVEDTAGEVVTIVKNNPVVLAGVAIVALGVGVVIGYKVAEHRLQTKYDKLMINEIAEAKEFYSRANAKHAREDKSEQETQEVREAAQALARYQGAHPPIESEITEGPADPMFTNPGVGSRSEDSVLVSGVTLNGQPVDDEFDYEAEEAKRTPDRPYVISQLEFFQNESELEQSSVTYYRNDDTLCDERDRPIEDIEKTVGSDNLQQFGHGSKDPNVVYVRNEKFRMEWEITLSEGSFKKEVLGLDDEDEQIHPANLRVRRGDHG